MPRPVAGVARQRARLIHKRRMSGGRERSQSTDGSGQFFQSLKPLSGIYISLDRPPGMPANEDLYVLAPGEGEGGESGWVSPRPIDEAVVEAVTDATDLAADDVDEYVEVSAIAALLDGDSNDETLSFTVEDHDVVVDAGGQIRVDPE